MADAIDAAVQAFVSFFSSEAGEALVEEAVKVVVAAGVDAAVQAVQGKPKVGATATQLQTKVGATTPRAIIMGRAPIAGTVLTPTPLKSGKDDRFASNFYALSHAGPSGVVESVIWGDDTVTFDANGNAIGKYNDNMWLFQKNGDWNQTAISYSGHAVLGSSTPSAWDSTKRARGCLTVALVVRYAAKVLGGNMQTPLFVVDANAAVLIDPRTGSPATTQAQRRNPAVWAYSWRLGWFQNSKRVIGMGQASGELHAAGYAYAANVADANGWVISGEATTADDRYAVETAILQACASTPVERNGLQSVVTSALRSSVGTITSNDLRADPKWRYNTQQSSRPTAIQTRYRSESNRWQMVEGAEVTDASWLTQDAGREKRVMVEYAYAGGGSAHVGHLAALEASNAREPLVFNLSCKQQARYAGFVGDAVTVSLPEIGLSSTKMTVQGRIVNSDGTVDYELLVETDAKYDFAAGKTSAAPSFTLQPGFDIFSVPQPGSSEWAAVAAQITSGATSLPIVRVTGSAADYSFASGVVFKIRLNSDGSPWLVSEDAPPAVTQHEFRGLTNATSYIVGVAYRGVTGVEGPVRELAAVTTGTMVSTSTGAVEPGAVRVGTDIFPGSGSTPLPGTQLLNSEIGIDGNGRLTNTGTGSAVVDNSRVIGFANQAIDTEFTYPERTWTNAYVSGGTWTNSTNTTGGVRYYRRSTSNAAAGAAANLGSDSLMAFPVTTGQRIEASVTVGWLNTTGATLYVTWYDANRGYIGDSFVASTSTNGATIGGFVTAPTNARFAGLTVQVVTVTANVSTYGEIGRPFLRLASAEQTALSPYVPGPVERNANQGATVGSDFRFPDQSIAPIGRVDNAQIGIDANGRLTNTGTGSAIVGNAQITIDALGRLTTTGTGSVVVDNSKITLGTLGFTGATDATRNVVSTGLLSARPTGVDGDMFFATDDNNGAGLLYTKIAGAWVADPKAKVLFDNLTTTVNANEATNSSFRSSQATNNSAQAASLTALEARSYVKGNQVRGSRPNLDSANPNNLFARFGWQNQGLWNVNYSNFVDGPFLSQSLTSQTNYNWFALNANAVPVSSGVAMSAQAMLGKFGTWAAGTIGIVIYWYSDPEGTTLVSGATNGVVQNWEDGLVIQGQNANARWVRTPNQIAPTGAQSCRLGVYTANATGNGVYTEAGAWMLKLEYGSTCTAWTDEAMPLEIDARVRTEESARASADSALATRATTLEATVNNGTTGVAATAARLTTEESTRASADTALAGRATALEATVNNGTTGVAATAARLTTEESTRASADAALATRATTLEAKVIADQQADFLTNGAFLRGTTGWNPSVGITVGGMTPEGVSGRNGVSLQVFSGGGTQYYETLFTVPTWKTLDLAWTGITTLWGGGTNTGASVRVYLQGKTGAGGWVTMGFTTAFTDLDQLTTPKTLRATASPGYDTVRLLFEITPPSSGNTLAFVLTQKVTNWTGEFPSLDMGPRALIGTEARIATEETTRATADSALATRATNLESTVNNGTTGVAATAARLTTEESARASGDSANASLITTLTARSYVKGNLVKGSRPNYDASNPNNLFSRFGWLFQGLWNVGYSTYLDGPYLSQSLTSQTNYTWGGLATNAMPIVAGLSVSIQAILGKFGTWTTGTLQLQIYWYSDTAGNTLHSGGPAKNWESGIAVAGQNSQARWVDIANAVAPSGVQSFRLGINTINATGNGSYTEGGAWMLKAEYGTTCTAWTDDALPVEIDARVTSVNSVAVDGRGRAYAISGTQTEVNGRKGGFVMDNDGSVTNFQITADDFRIYQSVGGANIVPFRVVGGQTQINDALVRTLNVIPDGGGPSHRVQLRPNSLSGADGASFTFSPAYGGIPLIRPVVLQPPALAAGETYDISATSLSASGFTVRAKKFTPGTPTAQSSGAGSNVGGTPAWQAAKPTSADADGNAYTYSWTATLPRVSNEFMGSNTWYAEYQGEFDVYYNAGSGWVYAYSTYLSFASFYTGSSPSTVTGQGGATTAVLPAIGQHGGNEFGLHAVSGTITAFAGVTYTTTSQSSVVSLPGNFTFDIYPPT